MNQDRPRCGATMAACQNDAGHPGAHWHPRVMDEPGVVPLRPPWVSDVALPAAPPLDPSPPAKETKP